MLYSNDKCFLCNCHLSKGKKGNYSEEHVFPEWLLDKNKDLKNEKLTSSTSFYTLLIHNERDKKITRNVKELSYTKAKISCCKKHNNEDLSCLEEKIKRKIYDEIKLFEDINIQKFLERK